MKQETRRLSILGGATTFIGLVASSPLWVLKDTPFSMVIASYPLRLALGIGGAIVSGGVACIAQLTALEKLGAVIPDASLPDTSLLEAAVPAAIQQPSGQESTSPIEEVRTGQFTARVSAQSRVDTGAGVSMC